MLIPDSSLMLEYNFLLATVAFELEKPKGALSVKLSKLAHLTILNKKNILYLQLTWLVLALWH